MGERSLSRGARDHTLCTRKTHVTRIGKVDHVINTRNHSTQKILRVSTAPCLCSVGDPQCHSGLVPELRFDPLEQGPTVDTTGTGALDLGQVRGF